MAVRAALPGEFETHLTVHLDGEERLSALQQWATNHGLKCVHIILDRGAMPSQPMLTRHAVGTFSEQLASANSLVQTLNAAGFSVTRVKIEAAPWNRMVPQSSLEALSHPSNRYFEHHIKLLLPSDTDRTALAGIASQHTAHLSRNALKKRDDGGEERFVTQRCYSVDRAEAREQFDALLNALKPLGYPVLSIEEEFVVYDSNTAIDAGWISPGE